MRGKSELSWTNITRDAMSPQAQESFDAVLSAIANLEMELAIQAVQSGAAQDGDEFKFAYRSIKQGSIGMAIDTPKAAQTTGFAGLKRPANQREVEATKLADYLRDQRASGRRY